MEILHILDIRQLILFVSIVVIYSAHCPRPVRMLKII